MTDLNLVDAKPALDIPGAPPASRAELRARLREVTDAIAAIRIQIATADLKRQAQRAPIDPDWFYRAKTALRHLERERAEVRERLAALTNARSRLKDHIIAVVQPQYDTEAWRMVLEVARRALHAEAG